ncbi:uncharacterized protein LOC117331821 [Pecten maximus]|uniref:uncharacterized protein LOC117331821 n=1 Tax=Pecten maximus TaxID=6579 RepID=UPI001458D80B|nr:uncharacterized protein LOC117331821 [Pecten maximus]
MNWVGGARNRVRFSNERKIQKEFFERKKFDAKTATRHRVTTSDRKHSEDLKAIHTISSMHSDTFSFQQQWRPLKMLDLDKFRSKSSIFVGDIDLGPSSPIKTPSKLHLLEASHQKQVAPKMNRSTDDDDLFSPKPSQKHPRLCSSDENSHIVQTSQLSYSQTKFKIPGVPKRTQTVPNSDVDDRKKVWNRKITDEMFKHSSLPKKKHKAKFEPYSQSSRCIQQHDSVKDLFGMNLKLDQDITLYNPGKDIPAVPFVSKSTPINPTGRDMFITEDFQMTPIRKYQMEKNVIPKLGLSHLSRNVDLSDLSDVDQPENVKIKLRPRVFQGEDFMQTPLINVSPPIDLFQAPLKPNFSNGTNSQRAVDNIIFGKHISQMDDEDKVKTNGICLNEANFQTPLYKFTPRTHLQPVVSVEDNHDMHPSEESCREKPNWMLPRSQESFITTLNDFIDSTTDHRFKAGHMTISETASFPGTISMQDAPTESASLSVIENHTQKEEVFDEILTHGKRTAMTEILDEMQELEKQDKMDEWMMLDECEVPHQKESCIDQTEEEEILFPSDDEEVKDTMNDMLMRVVADCSDDFEFDRYESLTEGQCSIPTVRGPDTTMEESHPQLSDGNGSNKKDLNEITAAELSATDSGHDVSETRFRDATTSTIEKETCDKGTQYSPKIYNEPASLQDLLSSSNLYRRFSVKPIQLGQKKDEREQPSLGSGKGSLNSVETAYCLRSRKKF